MKHKYYQFIAIFLLHLILVGCHNGANSRRISRTFPSSIFQLLTSETEKSSARHARQLVHDNTWATVSTISVQFNGVPYGSTLSYSDGIGYSKENSTGQLFFYLTLMDPSGKDLSINSTASISMTMAQEGQNACKMDIEDPTCWKLTLLGNLVPVVSLNERHYAEKVLFSKHPQMKQWPRNHEFRPYVLEIKHIILLDFYGGAKHVLDEDGWWVEFFAILGQDISSGWLSDKNGNMNDTEHFS
ncbi:unnamed protein product [Peronospora belbahrii]|uniref:CREG-like beta-barrel domain-containing protein n=1 Tax=Peronospora belbahrii TaxID=622444 RepID=A0AAU9L0E2_9STRA|nr:unnamed protein product [Peronospora belbahrii]CAH0520193.1 unnamed protein product [Peronospora belbahrii]